MGDPAIPGPALVTGATGFIGRRLVARLVDEGVPVRALVLPSDAVPTEWGEGVEVMRGDVTRAVSLVPALRDAGSVFHLAAVVGDWGAPEDHERITVRGTRHVLEEAARQGARVLLASSFVVYGDCIPRDVCVETHPHGRPLGPYSRSKQAQERLARELEGSHGLKVTIIRPTNVYGPGSRPWVDMAVQQLRKEAPMLVGDGERCAGITYVDNVVDVFARAAGRAGTIGRTYNANDDHGVTWKRYFNDLAKISGAPVPKALPEMVGALAAQGFDRMWRAFGKQDRPMVTREAFNLVRANTRVPIDRARQELGYVPAVSYSDGMRAVAEYLSP